MSDSWKDFKMQEREPEVREYMHGLMLVKRNGTSRDLTLIETLLYMLLNKMPKDDSTFKPVEELSVLRAPNENRFFIQGYNYKRDLKDWETFLFVIFDIEPKEVRLSKRKNS